MSPIPAPSVIDDARLHPLSTDERDRYSRNMLVPGVGVVSQQQVRAGRVLLVGGADPLVGRMLLVNPWRNRYDEVPVARNPDCPVCGDHPTVTELIDYDQFCGVRLPDMESSDEEVTMKEIDAAQLRSMLAGAEQDGHGASPLSTCARPMRSRSRPSTGRSTSPWAR